MPDDLQYIKIRYKDNDKKVTWSTYQKPRHVHIDTDICTYIDIRDDKEATAAATGKWKNCHGPSGAYVGQMTICAVVVGVSLYQIIAHINDSTDKTIYCALISGVIGYILPAPHAGD